MQKLVLILMLVFMSSVNSVSAKMVEGGVSAVGAASGGNRVVDNATNQPVSNAKVTLPHLQYKTYTDENGTFQLGAAVKDKTVMSIEKEGYRPFSLTLDEKSASAPIIVGIQKSKIDDISIETQINQMADNNY